MRMIDRWFPCSTVSEASFKTYGSGNMEKGLFTWFAARPIAQARAAILTTLLPWPEDKAEQRRLQDLVIGAIKGEKQAIKNVAAEVRSFYPDGARVLDPFSGRAIIPLEAARAGVESWGIDYSPVATLAGMLLADFPFRDWSMEPKLPFDASMESKTISFSSIGESGKLARDVRMLLEEIGRRHEYDMDEFYPKNNQGELPWSYLWTQMMPCDECKHYFPLVGSTVLREPDLGTSDPGSCFSFVADRASGELEVVIHEGIATFGSTLLSSAKRSGKVAKCPFCDHPHVLDIIKAKGNAGLLRDKLLIVADLDPKGRQVFRLPTSADLDAVVRADQALRREKPFRSGITAVPNEIIPAGNNHTVRASLYGVRNYGDLCCARQTLSFVRLCRIIANLQPELHNLGCSDDYIRALLGYAGAVVVRKLRRSTRGATLAPSRSGIADIFKNRASLNYGYDFLETGIGSGPGTWRSISSKTLNVVEKLTCESRTVPARIRLGSALHLPFKPKSITAVVTDPPYYNMIDYSDASDLFFVWIKRALGVVYPELFDTIGVQDKAEEIIVKNGSAPDEHRTPEFYTTSLKTAFVNARSILRDEGALTLVFGHGDPDAWLLLLSALVEARFIITGSWPARTEAGTGAGSANIVVTITIACRPASSVRPDGLQATVDLEVEREIQKRIATWEADGLALTDQLMAAYGPTMEVFGRYEHVLRPDGSSLGIDHYLSLARRTVQDATAIKVDGLPLETFDARTRFSLFWARLYGRQLAPKSEAVFQAMASNLRLDDVRRDILEENRKGYRLAEFGEFVGDQPYSGISSGSAVMSVVCQMVRGWRAFGGEGVATVLSLAEREPDDAFIWAVISDLAGILPTADKDRKSMEEILRNRKAIESIRTVLDRKHFNGDTLQMSLFSDNDELNVAHTVK